MRDDYEGVLYTFTGHELHTRLQRFLEQIPLAEVRRREKTQLLLDHLIPSADDRYHLTHWEVETWFMADLEYFGGPTIVQCDRHRGRPLHRRYKPKKTAKALEKEAAVLKRRAERAAKKAVTAAKAPAPKKKSVVKRRTKK